MTLLQQALELTPWRLLLFIGRQRGLSLSSKISKADLVDRLAGHLRRLDSLGTTLVGLSVAEEQALFGLLAAGGSLPLRYLQPLYGTLRSPGQLPSHYPARTVPAESAARMPPLSPLERLRALGLIFYHRSTQEVFIPTDLMPLLPAPPTVSSPQIAAPTNGWSLADLLCHDLAYLLALLNRDEIQPWPGHWLPPGVLRDWGQHCAVPPTSPHARSELQTSRRRFLHYLAENAGWVNSRSPLLGPRSSPSDRRPQRAHGLQASPLGTGDRGLLTPTPAAWLWLQTNRDERLQRLWQTWVTPQPELWRAYRLPGHDWLADPVRLLAPLHQALTELDAADPARFGQMLLARSPALLDLVPANLLDPAEALVETIEQLLIGPLVWLGVLSEQGSRGAGGRR